MNFDEWLETYYSGTQIDDVIAGMMRTAFEAGRCEASAVSMGCGNSERGLKSLLDFTQDDGLAATYQTIGQYRSEIIKIIASILVEQKMTKFKIGDKLRYKIAQIDLTFEIIAIDKGNYVLKSSKGEEVSADFFHVHEVLEVFLK